MKPYDTVNKNPFACKKVAIQLSEDGTEIRLFNAYQFEKDIVPEQHVKVKSFDKLSIWEQTSKDFDLNDIEGFIYGATASRFWMLRKFINSYEFASSSQGSKMPFYSW